MKRSPALVALLQVSGVILYVLALVSTINYFSTHAQYSDFDNPLLGMSIFLLTFVTSALICGSLILGYPVQLFLDNEKRRAIEIVLWSAAWLVIVLLLITASIFLTQG